MKLDPDKHPFFLDAPMKLTRDFARQVIRFFCYSHSEPIAADTPTWSVMLAPHNSALNSHIEQFDANNNVKTIEEVATLPAAANAGGFHVPVMPLYSSPLTSGPSEYKESEL